MGVCKAAIFKAGAGRYPGPGNYTECCWQADGKGQFRPGDAANPNVGEVGKLEEIEEVRVEALCLGEGVVRKAVTALKEYVFFSSFICDIPPSFSCCMFSLCGVLTLLWASIPIIANFLKEPIPLKSQPIKSTASRIFDIDQNIVTSRIT